MVVVVVVSDFDFDDDDVLLLFSAGQSHHSGCECVRLGAQ